MLKFSTHLKNLSKQKMKVYGIFRTIPEEERAVYEAEARKNIPTDLDSDKLDFALSHQLVSVVTSKQQFEEFATAYYLQNHWDHFELWCPCHGFESTDAPGAVEAYYENCLADENGQLDSDLTIVTWTYSADDLARVLRMFFGCVPVDASYEAPDKSEFDFFTQNLSMAVRECVSSFTLDQLMTIIQSACSKEVCSAVFSADDAKAEPQDTELPAQQPMTEGQKKKRGRPKKVTSNQEGESK